MSVSMIRFLMPLLPPPSAKPSEVVLSVAQVCLRWCSLILLPTGLAVGDEADLAASPEKEDDDLTADEDAVTGRFMRSRLAQL